MKKIIMPPQQDKRPIYQHKCSKCGYFFEFEPEDVDDIFIDHRDGFAAWYVTCPKCYEQTVVINLMPIRYE